MAAGGGGGRTWIVALGVGLALVVLGTVLERLHVGGPWPGAVALGVGGLLVVFGACEAMIQSVERIAARLKLNDFVAGTMAGLASNVPELVMLGFVLVAAPRVGFIVTALTLHVGAAAFGIYSGLLPRDDSGHASLPEPLVKLTTDLFACAGGAFFATGTIMVLMNVFDAGDHQGEALGAADLTVLGLALLGVQVVALRSLMQRFAGPESAPEMASDAPAEPLPGWGAIAGYGALGLGASLVGGHAVGDFADVLVAGLRSAGYSEMVGALILSVFASAGAFVMIAAAHAKGMYDIALANASGQVSQLPFVVLPAAMLMLAGFGQAGMIPVTPHGGILPIDLQTTSVIFLGFPSMLILWKAVQDDGKVNWVETATMVAIFGLTIWFLAVHG